MRRNEISHERRLTATSLLVRVFVCANRESCVVGIKSIGMSAGQTAAAADVIFDLLSVLTWPPRRFDKRCLSTGWRHPLDHCSLCKIVSLYLRNHAEQVDRCGRAKR